jgi:hypothetical protein
VFFRILTLMIIHAMYFSFSFACTVLASIQVNCCSFWDFPCYFLVGNKKRKKAGQLGRYQAGWPSSPASGSQNPTRRQARRGGGSD